MKVTFSTAIKECPPDVALYLISIALKCEINEDTVNTAFELGYVKDSKLKNCIIITKEGRKIVSEAILASVETGDEETRLAMLAEQLRSLYPKGRKPGTNLMWKDSVFLITQKLRALNKKCAEMGKSFTNEEAIDATKRYIESFNGDYTYMQVLKYFILKNDAEKGEQMSQLLSFIENEDATTDNSSWMNTVR